MMRPYGQAKGRAPPYHPDCDGVEFLGENFAGRTDPALFLDTTPGRHPQMGKHKLLALGEINVFIACSWPGCQAEFGPPPSPRFSAMSGIPHLVGVERRASMYLAGV